MKPKTVQSILEEFSMARDYPPLMYEESMNTALAQIQQLLEECEPPKKVKDPSGYINEPNLRAWQNGYNQAIKEYKSNIRGKLK